MLAATWVEYLENNYILLCYDYVQMTSASKSTIQINTAAKCNDIIGCTCLVIVHIVSKYPGKSAKIKFYCLKSGQNLRILFVRSVIEPQTNI